VQGSVLLEIVVDENGWPLDIEVLSPLGFGLDEKAVEAVSPWPFKPGEKEGRPVAVRARVEVAFRLTDKGFDPKAERRRAPFNSIVARLGKTPDQKPSEQDATAMEDLARQKFAAACYALGIWQTAGRGVPQDAAAGLANIQKAADQKYGPALLFIGRAAISGDSMPKNTVKGLGLVREGRPVRQRRCAVHLGWDVSRGQGSRAFKALLPAVRRFGDAGVRVQAGAIIDRVATTKRSGLAAGNRVVRSGAKPRLCCGASGSYRGIDEVVGGSREIPLGG
jgi:TonB family protein